MNSGDLLADRYRLVEALGKNGFCTKWSTIEIKSHKKKTIEIFAERYVLEDRLGEGGFGEVWKAWDSVTNTNVAIKIHHSGKNASAAREIVKEYTRVMNIHHDNLLTPSYTDIADGSTPFLVMELCKQDIEDLAFDEETIWHLIFDISSGLKRLADNQRSKTKPDGTTVLVNAPIIHQDIKPKNILLRDNGRYAISDFGISKSQLSSLTTNETESQKPDSRMTIAYAAPERFPRGIGQAVLASDIWSLGAMLYELVQGQLPFDGCGGAGLTSNNDNNKIKIPPVTTNGNSDELKTLIYDCMATKPNDRPTASQLQNYAQNAINGNTRIMTWRGAPQSIKADHTKRESKYKGHPWDEKIQIPTFFENITQWLQHHKKPLLITPTICIAIAAGIYFFPQVISIFDNSERKAWRTAKQENTLVSYKTFIENYSKSRYVRNALTQIIRLDNGSNNLKGFHYLMFNADDAMNYISDEYGSDVYNGIIVELQDSILIATRYYQYKANSLRDRVTNYSYNHYYSDTAELNKLKMLVDDAISLNDKWNDINAALGNGSAKISIPQWEQYNESIIAALHTIQESFLKGIEELKQWRDNTTDEYKPYYQEAIETVERFCKETGESTTATSYHTL